jgi:hypothetical protein
VVLAEITANRLSIFMTPLAYHFLTEGEFAPREPKPRQPLPLPLGVEVQIVPAPDGEQLDCEFGRTATGYYWRWDKDEGDQWFGPFRSVRAAFTDWNDHD